MLTQERLKEILILDLDTCIFTYRIRRGPKIAGSVAGCLRKDGYREIKIDSSKYLTHRLVFLYITGKFPENEIDHINGIKDDNSWYNLRDVTHVENTKNVTISKINTSGTTGVSWYARTNKWYAHIRAGGKRKHIGYFTKLQDAIDARKAAEIEYDYHKNHGRKQK